MSPRPARALLLASTVLCGCGAGAGAPDGGDDGGVALDAGGDLAGPAADLREAPCLEPARCAAIWEGHATARFDALLANPVGLAAFLAAVPKGGDLHNHLSGAVYAETYLEWAADDGICINGSTLSAVAGSQCSITNLPVPDPGPFYGQIISAWSMFDFMPGAESGHDHFFATFGKFGLIAGAHRDESIADVAARAAGENQVYVETMFNLGRNISDLAATVSTTTVTAANLSPLYDALIADPSFAGELASDVAVVTDAATRYRSALGCAGANPPPACEVTVRFIAQIARTGAADRIFGQMVSAWEMAARVPYIVGANLSSPEDDTASLRNYDLHMAMLDFLYNKYTATKKSPLHITLHAGELTPEYLPAGYETANTFHVRRAVEVGHAERIGHGVDVLSETDPAQLLDELRDRDVLVEVCLSSNAQILEVSGAAHPLAKYLRHDVPVALATDDQGVSRSSLAGEYLRAALDQGLGYRQLKTLARNSLAHAFLPGAGLWISVAAAQPVADCAPPDTLALGDLPGAACAQLLAGSERARTQWELERRFLAFERKQ